MHDVIVVGGRVAGSALAIQLARAGLDLVVVDRCRFPSDTLSTHQMQVVGVSRLAELGVLDRVLAAGTPPTRRIRFHAAGSILDAPVPRVDGQDFMLSPRRTVLDTALIDAARDAGADVWEGVGVESLLRDGERVVGVRARARTDGQVVEERARLVVGADGHRSTIARLVDARPYDTRPARTVASYTYWDGLTADGGEMYSGTGWAAGAWPTNDGLTLTYAARPIGEWDEVRRNPERALLGVLARAGDLGARARTATRIGPVRTTNDTGAAFHTASGSGWLLVGDAGLVLDPITGLGMTHALEDATSAAAAVQRALDGSDVRALKGFGRQRYRRRKAIYELTADLAQLRGTTPAEEPLF
ncbi:MAG TPA: NAD(P)/FAD-dependent oxidoreductase, partial [Microlunatus sp.]|nr:NAD(P)/FAD-dependent oxidoreductase [Microlunatus sp.]